MPGATRINPVFSPRPWGPESLAPWFDAPPGKVGEVWFNTPELLIKFIFTAAALSVQVHPDDVYARAHGNANGKTEMWYVLEASSGARIALGFRQPVTPEQVRAAALDGSIEQLLGWFTASPGDTFFTPAGTVHALGAGLMLCEIQQVSDSTYRMYDYGRGRPLHLDQALEVLDCGPHPGPSTPHALQSGGGTLLVRCPYFVTERHIIEEPRAFDGGSILIVLEGSARIEGAPVQRGQVWRLVAPVVVEPEGRLTLLRTYVPAGKNS